jgi:hypothetical protein
MHGTYHDAWYISRCAVYITMRGVYHDVRHISRCTAHITMHGTYHDARYISRCTVHITIHGIYHDARYISRCAVHITMRGIYHDARYLSRCAVDITMRGIYHDARYISRCAVYITMRGTYHDARSAECQINVCVCTAIPCCCEPSQLSRMYWHHIIKMLSRHYLRASFGDMFWGILCSLNIRLCCHYKAVSSASPSTRLLIMVIRCAARVTNITNSFVAAYGQPSLNCFIKKV